MTTSEYQTQTIVRNLREVEVWTIDRRFGRQLRKFFEFFLQTSLTAQPVDGLVFGCLDNPGAGRFRNALRAPLIDGGSECFLGSVFGELEITKLTYECCNNPSPIRTIYRVDSSVRVWKHV